MHDEHAERRPGGLFAGTQLRPVVLGETASRAVFAEPWAPEEVLAVAPHDSVIGYLVVDAYEPRPALGGLGLYPTLSLQRVRTLAATTAQQLGLFGIHRGAYHAAVFATAADDATARIEELRVAVEPLVAAGALDVCYARFPDEYQPSAVRNGLAASATAAALAAADRRATDLAHARFVVAGDGPSAAPYLAVLASHGLDAAILEPGVRADIVIALGAAPAIDSRTLAKTGAGVIVSVESGAVSPAVEREMRKAGGICVPEQLAGAGTVLGCDLVSRGVAPEDTQVRVARAVSDATASCLQEAEATGLPLREVVTRRALVAREIHPTRGRSHRPRSG
jgi:hypothetical protein